MIPWSLAILNISLNTIGCGLLVLLYSRAKLEVPFTNLDSICQAFCIPITYTISLICITGFKHGNSSLLGFNAILQICMKAELHYSKYYRNMNYLKKRENKESVFLITLVLQCPLFPWLLTMTCLALNLEVYYFLLEEYVLTQPVWGRSVAENYVALIVRFCCILHVSSEAARLTGIGASSLLIFLTRIRRFLLIVSKEKRPSRFYKAYRPFYLAYGCLQDRFNFCLMLVYQALFVVSIQSLWCACKGYGRVQAAVYVMVCLTGVLVLLTNVIVLPMLFRTGVLCKKVLSLQKRRAKRRYVLSKTRINRMELVQLNSLNYLKLSCGSLFECDDDSMVVFFTQLNLRWFDAILLFRF